MLSSSVISRWRIIFLVDISRGLRHRFSFNWLIANNFLVFLPELQISLVSATDPVPKDSEAAKASNIVGVVEIMSVGSALPGELVEGTELK